MSAPISIDGALERLNEIARSADVPYPHWLGGDEADQGLSYCYECAEKAVSAGDGEYVDGGWQQDSDGCCHCETCGRLLDYTLTDYGVTEELSHFRAARLRGELHPEAAYHLARILEQHDEHPEVKQLLPKVRRALARTPQPTGNGGEARHG